MIGKKKQIEKERLYALKPWREYEDILTEIQDKVINANVQIKTMKPQLDDDDDIKLLDEYETKFHRFVIEAKDTYKEIKLAPSGRSRSSSTVRDELINILKGIQIKVNLLFVHLRIQFPTHSGGFGAKGRAHEMDQEILNNAAEAPVGKSLDNSFLDNIQIDGNTSNLNVYKTSPKVNKEKSGPMVIMGADKSNYNNKAQTLQTVERGLFAIEAPQGELFKSTPVGKDRGLGQYANMNNTNAAGYAWLVGFDGAESQRWEWLHIRGAGIGGSTDSTNLVAGTRDANTHMIPFESNIRTLATAVANNKEKYSGLNVEWSVSNRKAGHAYEGITIKWKLLKKDNTIQTQGEANFSPLHTSSNISKGEVDKLEGALKEARDKV